MATSNSRVERRRRIAERGSDRLALITGQIESLQTSSFSSSPTHRDHSRTQSAPPLFAQDLDVPRTNLSGQIKVAPDGEIYAHGSTLLKHETTGESRGNNLDIRNQAEPHLDKSKVSGEAIQAQADGDGTKMRSSLLATSIQTEPFSKPHGHRPNFFTAKQINSCIIASQNTRIFCALIIAFLVVLSYIDYPLFGMNIVRSESVIASRPLYIVLLTDVTIVLGRLILVKRKGYDEVEEERMAPQDDGHNWAGAVKVLETGLVVYQTIRAVFIDCSVYVVFVICGLSLV